ncbi:glycosyl transferase [Spirochaetia bacterium]|nr:glycosyl transferase [Spirochaetia bacterium]
MDVSIIIVNYNTKQLLYNCLMSIYEQTKDIDFEIIVSDNGSIDGSNEMIHMDFPHVILIKNNSNLGFGTANNIGAKAAKGKYLFFLNSDTIILNNAIKVLVDYLESNAKAGVCGGNLFDENKKPTFSYEMFLPSVIREINIFLKLAIEKILFRENSRFNHTNNPKKVGYISGADLLIRTDLFRRLNGFDPDFFMYYEETELTYRVKKVGYKVYNIPQAHILHLEGKSLSDNLTKQRISLKSRKIYYMKTYDIFLQHIVNSIFSLTILSRCVLYKLTGNIAGYNYWVFISKNLRTL